MVYNLLTGNGRRPSGRPAMLRHFQILPNHRLIFLLTLRHRRGALCPERRRQVGEPAYSRRNRHGHHWRLRNSSPPRTRVAIMRSPRRPRAIARSKCACSASSLPPRNRIARQAAKIDFALQLQESPDGAAHGSHGRRAGGGNQLEAQLQSELNAPEAAAPAAPPVDGQNSSEAFQVSGSLSQGLAPNAQPDFGMMMGGPGGCPEVPEATDSGGQSGPGGGGPAGVVPAAASAVQAAGASEAAVVEDSAVQGANRKAGPRPRGAVRQPPRTQPDPRHGLYDVGQLGGERQAVLHHRTGSRRSRHTPAAASDFCLADRW